MKKATHKVAFFLPTHCLTHIDGRDVVTLDEMQGLLGEALHYLHGQWPKLVRFLDNGAWLLDSNPVENAIRPFVVGRRSWLFADTVGGANASANLYSLIETAKANNIEPYRYLVALFKKLPLAQTIDDYEALLPWNIELVEP